MTIQYKEGNLLEENVNAVVNTVNTVGIMGKGIALMFKERYPDNFKAYEAACKNGSIQVGRMFLQPSEELSGPQWIINFPTKKHWRHPSKLEWIEQGLDDLRSVIIKKGIKSIAVPPLGCGNGGLDWGQVKDIIQRKLQGLGNTRVVVFEPTQKYQNIAKRSGVKELTIPRALIAESVRRYWVLGIECTLLEIQKLAWFLERIIMQDGLANHLALDFEANRYGPYSYKLNHLLDSLDGSYLRSEKRISDCQKTDTIAFVDSEEEEVSLFLKTGDSKPYQKVIEKIDKLIDGFQSPYGLELLATVDWLLFKENCEASIKGLQDGLLNWKGGKDAGERKYRIFNAEALSIALKRIQDEGLCTRNSSY